MAKAIHDGLRLYTARNLEDQIKLYELEIKEIGNSIKALEKLQPEYITLADSRGTVRHYKKIVKWLKELQQRRESEKHGSWIDIDPLRWECSACGYQVNRWNNTPYCPKCGAQMSEDKV